MQENAVSKKVKFPANFAPAIATVHDSNRGREERERGRREEQHVQTAPMALCEKQKSRGGREERKAGTGRKVGRVRKRRRETSHTWTSTLSLDSL